MTLARAVLLAVFLFANLFHPAAAQTISGTIRFETLSVEDGLSQSTVQTILQDNIGFMWFGTDDGLNKYDGYTFTIYKHDTDSAASLANSTISALYEDRQGELWIGTASGLDRFNRQDETFHHFLTGLSITTIIEDSNGDLWVGSADNGLRKISKDGIVLSEIQKREPKNSDTLASNQISSLALVPNQGLWIGTSEGLDYLDLQRNVFTHYTYNPSDQTSISDNRIQALFRDSLGSLWIGTEGGGLNRFDTLTQRFTRYQSRPNNPYTLSGNFVRSIYQDKAGHLWVGGRNGLHRFNQLDEYFTRYQHDPSDPSSMSNNYVLSIFEDRSGVLWIGTYGGGLSKYAQANDRFDLYQHRPSVPNSLSNDIVNAIFEDHEQVVWVGTLDGGLNRMDPESSTFIAYQNNPSDSRSISGNDVRAIYEDRYGSLWVGTYGNGLNLFDRNANRFLHYVNEANNPNSISDNRVMVIYEDRRGNLWIGTRGGGLNLMDRTTGRFTHFRHILNDPNSLASDFVNTIYEDQKGQLWIGTNNGISVRDPLTGNFKQFQSESHKALSLSDNRVQSILETNDGSVWIGTMVGGLNRFDPVTQGFHRYTQKQGLPGDSVYGILADRNGYLWLSTNKGISRFYPVDSIFRNYDPQDGLQSHEFNPGAYFENSRGRMFFGGKQGFNAFDPSTVSENNVPPPVIITAFKKFNQIESTDLTGNEKIELSYQDNYISFEFAALDYGAPEKNQYEYKLEGFDKDWVSAGTRRYTSYTNLRGGNYVFRVIGSNQDGVWNQTGASVVIVVVPPIWERWWFISSLGILLVSLAFGGYRLRMVSIQQQNRTLEALVFERTQEIQRRREVAEGLREILAILNSNRSLKESLDSIIRQIVRLMEAQAVIIFRAGEEGYPFVVAHNLPENGQASANRETTSRAGSLASGLMVEPLPGWISMPVMQGQHLRLPDLAWHKVSQMSGAGKNGLAAYQALLAVPLVVNDKVDGGLVLLYEKPQRYSDEDYQMAISFADHAALAIANAMLRSQAEEIAVSAERSRLARDLHDAVTQTLFATSLIAEVLPKLWERNPEAGMQKINEIRELTRGALAEMRTLLMELRPTALEDVPLPDLLQQLSEAFTGRARVPVVLDLDRPVEMSFNAKIVFYRIAQEALNNIQKHSRASQVKICLEEEDGRVRMSIFDNGTGFNPEKRLPDHFGLGIMEERAQSIHAQFSVHTQPGEGTKIQVDWQSPTD